MPLPQSNIKLVTYADDTTILAKSNDIKTACDALNRFLPELHSFFTSRNLQISEAKSTATVFTSWTKEVNKELDIHINGKYIPTVKYPKVLGVTFDNLHTFAKHAETLANKVRDRNRILKAIAGSTWGQQTEVLATTYKAIGRSLLDYASPVWSPGLSDTQWGKLQSVQNSALRIVTGCHFKTPEQHTHHETKMLTVKQHCTLLNRQFLRKTKDSAHPNNIALIRPANSRSKAIRMDIRRENPAISHLAETDLKKSLQIIHQTIVQEAIESYKCCVVLGGRPPPVDESEKQLPRPTRCTLSQLRSGISVYLKSYLSILNPEVVDACPHCGVSPHITRHLFDCASRQTDLTPLSLWTDPVKAAIFLELDI